MSDAARRAPYIPKPEGGGFTARFGKTWAWVSSGLSEGVKRAVRGRCLSDHASLARREELDRADALARIAGSTGRDDVLGLVRAAASEGIDVIAGERDALSAAVDASIVKVVQDVPPPLIRNAPGRDRGRGLVERLSKGARNLASRLSDDRACRCAETSHRPRSSFQKPSSPSAARAALSLGPMPAWSSGGRRPSASRIMTSTANMMCKPVMRTSL